MSTFPTVKRSKRGYNTTEVDDFLAKARDAYDGAQGARLSADDIRHTAFGMHKGGYQPEKVDAALERLEDAFAAREREVARAEVGEAQRLTEARATAQVILNRLGRDEGQRFSRAGAFSYGYSRSDVDRFAMRLSRYFRDGKPMSVDEVRTVVFKAQRHGYREQQVDLLLDGVVDVMLAVR